MIAFFKYLQKLVNREFSSSIFPEERCALNKFVRCLMSQVVFLSRGEHCLTGWEYVLTDIIIIRDFIVGPPVLDDVALCRDKSLLLSRSDVSVLDSPSPTDKGWTARWVSVARIHGSPSLSLSPSLYTFFLAILHKFQPDKLSRSVRRARPRRKRECW